MDGSTIIGTRLSNTSKTCRSDDPRPDRHDASVSRRHILTSGVLTLLAACGRKKHARKVPPAPSPPVIPRVGDAETGLASWYGHPYHGRRAADGETYDMETLVAAHRTLPFHTWVQVINLTNRKQVEVRIIDRGPFVGGRIIDLSHAAAQAIDMIGPGTAEVRVVVLRVPSAVPPGVFAVQVGAFRDRNNAERLRDEMQARYGTARTVKRDGNPPVWRVLVGAERTEDGATGLARKIRQENEKSAAFVVRLDSV